MSVPDAIAPESGYRTWAVGLGRLWSVQGPGRIRWPRSQPLRASCLKHGPLGLFRSRPPEHPAPDRLCTCGIYGVFDPWNIETRAPRGPWTLVAGRVEGWGRVVIGTRGFRAALARPVDLFAEPWWDECTAHTVAGVAGAYGVPLALEHAAVTG